MSEPEWVPVHRVLDDHYPSMTDENEVEIDNAARLYVSDPGIDRDAADLALRTCQCGVPIDGFYEYVGHLKAVFKDLWT